MHVYLLILQQPFLVQLTCPHAHCTNQHQWCPDCGLPWLELFRRNDMARWN